MANRRGNACNHYRSSGPKGRHAFDGTNESERAAQLVDLTATGDDDNAECAAADLAREFSDPIP